MANSQCCLEKYRGQLLLVNREGEIQKSIPLANDDFGGLAFANGHLYAALTNDSSILKIDVETGMLVDKISLASPAGGLAYDPSKTALIAQLYIGHPHWAVVDLDSKETKETLWSD